VADAEPVDGAPALQVIRAGLLDLLVDQGRHGWQRFGMPQGGPADAESYRVAAILAGGGTGAESLAAIEVTAAGPVLEAVGSACRLAVVSAGEADVTVQRGDGGDEPVPPFTSVTLRPGDRLAIGRIGHVLRAYIAVRGGIDVPPQLGSRSTCLRGGTTGLLARPLRPGDLLPLDASACEPRGPERSMAPPAILFDRSPLAILDGPQKDHLRRADARSLLRKTTVFRAAAAIDRTGIRLEGPAFPLRFGADVASQGCPAGALQVTGDGSAILLGPDRGTTGGYAIPAVVASWDLPRLGRIRPGGIVRFDHVDSVDLAEATGTIRARAIEELAETVTYVF
jgi:biotin-dependent carboxylase-like uncharacterized protein